MEDWCNILALTILQHSLGATHAQCHSTMKPQVHSWSEQCLLSNAVQFSLLFSPGSHLPLLSFMHYCFGWRSFALSELQQPHRRHRQHTQEEELPTPSSRLLLRVCKHRIRAGTQCTYCMESVATVRLCSYRLGGEGWVSKKRNHPVCGLHTVLC